jgi:hypothetical protein
MLGRQGVATGIIRSWEGYYNLVKRDYEKLLDREPTNAELNAGIVALQHGAIAEAVVASILATPEFLAHSANIAPSPSDPNSNFVQALYVLLLNRTPVQSEVDGWVSKFPVLGQVGIANNFLVSGEFRFYAVQALYFTDPAFGTWAFIDIFPNMLHRVQRPSLQEILNWGISGLDLLTIECIIGGSGEFYAQG